MREPTPSRINLPVLVFVVALHAVVFWYAVHAPPPRITADTRGNAPAASPSAKPPAQPSAAERSDDAETSEIATDDPRRTFTPQQWSSNQAVAAQAQDRQKLGTLAPDSANPAQLPAAIERGLRRGDANAANAAAELHEDCSAFGETAPGVLTFDTKLLAGLDAQAQALARADFMARVLRLEQRRQRCAAWRSARENLAAARRDYAARADADAFEKLRSAQQLDPPTPSLLERLRRELRALWESQSQSRVGRALVLQLLADDNEGQDRIGLRLLLELAERDDTQVEFAASILSQGYGHLPPQPDLAPQWQRRAADLGADAAIDAQLAAPATPPSQAWAWRAWRIWLNAHGCYVDTPRAEDALLVDDLRALQQLDGALSPGERAEAGRLYLERTAAFGDRARAVRRCDTQAGAPH
jgi:hypothetical protein